MVCVCACAGTISTKKKSILLFFVCFTSECMGNTKKRTPANTNEKKHNRRKKNQRVCFLCLSLSSSLLFVERDATTQRRERVSKRAALLTYFSCVRLGLIVDEKSKWKSMSWRRNAIHSSQHTKIDVLLMSSLWCVEKFLSVWDLVFLLVCRNDLRFQSTGARDRAFGLCGGRAHEQKRNGNNNNYNLLETFTHENQLNVLASLLIFVYIYKRIAFSSYGFIQSNENSIFFHSLL